MTLSTFQDVIKRFFVNKPGDIVISNRSYHLIIFLLFGWYVFQMLYFAFSIRPGIPPDEIYHLELSVLHAESRTIRLADSPETYKFGAVSTQAYLYHL